MLRKYGFPLTNPYYSQLNNTATQAFEGGVELQWNKNNPYSSISEVQGVQGLFACSKYRSYEGKWYSLSIYKTAFASGFVKSVISILGNILGVMKDGLALAKLALEENLILAIYNNWDNIKTGTSEIPRIKPSSASEHQLIIRF